MALTQREPRPSARPPASHLPRSIPPWPASLLWRHSALWVSLLAVGLLCPKGAPAEAAVSASQLVNAAPAVALRHAHAHNDYEHERPLLDALAHGFTSVEADVWLVNGELLVAHDFFSLSPTRTLESLYLRPLLDRVAANRGRVYSGWPHSTQLLIDIKTDANRTYPALHRLLGRYRRLLTTFVGGRAYEAAITVVISGNRPRRLMQAQRVRYAAYDGRSADLGQDQPAGLVPLISERWHSLFDWDGDGQMPGEERLRLHAYVRTAHASGQRVRFWSTPDTSPQREAVWAELAAAGVDHINTDHLPALSHWLARTRPD
jgi:hypothetical protein